MKIPLDELPKALGSKYNLTPEKAAVFQKGEEDANRRETEEKAADEEREAAQHVVNNTFPILQAQTDTADLWFKNSTSGV